MQSEKGHWSAFKSSSKIPGSDGFNLTRFCHWPGGPIPPGIARSLGQRDDEFTYLRRQTDHPDRMTPVMGWSVECLKSDAVGRSRTSAVPDHRTDLRIMEILERAMRFELTTLTLAR